MTSYLQYLLRETGRSRSFMPFALISPREDDQKGAQISVRLRPGLLEIVLHHLEENGVIVDERKPDVIRIAPTPLYNTFLDVWTFVQIFFDACQKASMAESEPSVIGEEAELDYVDWVGRRDLTRGNKAWGPNGT